MEDQGNSTTLRPGYFSASSTARFAGSPKGEDGLTGIDDEADWDLSGMCGVCGAGARRTSPLRIAASELGRCSLVANIYAFEYFPPISERLVERIASLLPGPLPLEEIEQIGRGVRKERWYTLNPTVVVPEDALRFVAHTVDRCAACGALDAYPIDADCPNPDPNRVYPTYLDPGWWHANSALAALSPDWMGELMRTTRILGVRYRQIWIRHDVVKAFMSVPRLRMTFLQHVWLADDPEKPGDPFASTT